MASTPTLLIDECINLEGISLVWVNIHLQESNDAQHRLQPWFNHQEMFVDQAEFENYILHHVSEDDRLVLVIRGIFTDMDTLIAKIQDHHNQRQRCQDIDTSFAFNIFNIYNDNKTDRSSSDLNAQFLHSLLILDVLLRMKKTSSTNTNELIHLYSKAYNDNPIELNDIKNFILTYSPNQALWWYTSNTCLYRILNKAFRVDNINLLYIFHSFIHDLHQQLQKCQCKSFVRVYRGQLITHDELKHLQHSIGHYISMNSLLSTSLNRSLAIFYLGETNNSRMKLKRILFDIDADPQIDGIKPFGNIGQFSAFPNEEEVLFMPRSIFQLVDISYDHNENIFIVRMILCGDKQNHFKAIYEQNRNDYGGRQHNETNLMTLGNVLQRMGKFDDAEMFYHRQLNELDHINNSDNRLMSACYFNIGEILREKGEYNKSMIWYQKSLNIDIKTLPNDHPNIGNTYNSIGIVQEKTGDYESALDSYSIALKIALHTFGWDHTRVALCLNNMGNAYQALDNYLEALDCHRIALMIRKKNLPSNHHRLAASHNNIAVVYHRLRHFDLAYEYYKVALDINRKSLPPHHPDISKIVRNIGLLHEYEGNFSQALIEFQQEYYHRCQIYQSNSVDILEIEQDIERIRNKLL
ncbi:unnamed protein product [Rotaria sp. Silwood1]|nr:unnamed protein product [Rotaria sp. Silwood1]CAF1483612.1 unnamed protein product [Rotaria sp. Silwood1]CAF3659784.1 unnamed protein product [Rotaria sp. Silwood1]CAF4783888.1 unnamed protein product [Rotaria sp. Silwood1]